jgi:multiple sugar transport system permease protein
MIANTLLGDGGRPGTLTVTFIYAFFGTALQYLIGLGLALLTIQKLAGQRFFRVVFLLPMTITPVGIAYMFRMLTDTQGGPFSPLFNAAGLSNFAVLGDPWGARAAVIIGDIWQWVPFMYIVLLAGLEGRDLETEEAGLVDGAGRWQIFRYITLPTIVGVSATVILIRMIEAFKIIDLPNVLTGGGPGTATESVTLQSFVTWRSFNLGSSAAIAYTLLIVVTVVATAYARVVLPRAHHAND